MIVFCLIFLKNASSNILEDKGILNFIMLIAAYMISILLKLFLFNIFIPIICFGHVSSSPSLSQAIS